MVRSCLKSKTHAVERFPWPCLVTVQQPRMAPESLAAAKLRLMPSFSPLGKLIGILLFPSFSESLRERSVSQRVRKEVGVSTPTFPNVKSLSFLSKSHPVNLSPGSFSSICVVHVYPSSLGLASHELLAQNGYGWSLTVT